MKTRMYTLVIEADDDGAFDDALSEATRLLNQGNLSGTDRTENGAFYFDSTDDVPESKRPNR